MHRLRVNGDCGVSRSLLTFFLKYLLQNLKEREQALTVFSAPPSLFLACFLRENTRFATTLQLFMVLCWVDWEKLVALPTSSWEPCTLCLASRHLGSLPSKLPVCREGRRHQKMSDRTPPLLLSTLWDEDTHVVCSSSCWKDSARSYCV